MKFLLISLILAINCTSYAGDAEGNGGDGIEISGKVYLFDLFEQGVHLQPHIDTAQAPLEDVSKKITQKFSGFNGIMGASQYNEFIKLLSIQVSNISRGDRVFGEAVLQSIVHHNWVLSLLEIVDAKDDDGSDIVFNRPLVPIAIRNFRTIRINNNFAQKMDLQNFVAAVLHEALFAIIKPEAVSGSNGRYAQQKSRRVREVIGSVFAGPIDAYSLKAMVKGDFPSGGFEEKIFEKGAESLTYSYRFVREFNAEDILAEYFDPKSPKSLAAAADRVCKPSRESNIYFRYSSIEFKFASYVGTGAITKYYLDASAKKVNWWLVRIPISHNFDCAAAVQENIKEYIYDLH